MSSESGSQLAVYSLELELKRLNNYKFVQIRMAYIRTEDCNNRVYLKKYVEILILHTRLFRHAEDEGAVAKVTRSSALSPERSL